jgi:hypothetical protein
MPAVAPIFTEKPAAQEPQTEAPVVDGPVVKDRTYFAKQIRLRWTKARESILEVGRLIVEARKTLSAEEYSKFRKVDLPFDYSVLQKLSALAENERINDSKNRKFLPHSWNTLVEIMNLPDEAFEFGTKEGILNEKTTWKQVKELRDKFDPPLPKPPGKSTTATTTGRAVPVNVTLGSKPASTVDASKTTITVRRSDLAKGTILVLVSQETAEAHKKELADLSEDLLRLVAKYSFIGEVKVEGPLI